jgi:uncharacterized membrane protein
MKTQGKSIIVQIITTLLLVIGSAGSLLSVKAAAIVGALSAVLTLFLKTVYPSGQLAQGWDLLLWVTNIGMIILQAVNIFGSVIFIPVEVINYLTVIINTVILVVANQSYGLMKK